MSNRENIFQHTDNSAAVLAEFYKQAGDRLKQIIEDAVNSGRMHEVAYAREQQVKVAAIIHALETQSLPAMTQLLEQGYLVGVRDAQQTLLKAGVQDYATILNSRDRVALNILQQNATSTLSRAHAIIGHRVDGVLRQTSLDSLTQSQLVSETVPERAANLSQALDRAGLTYTKTANGGVDAVRFIDVGGRSFQLDNYTQMVARTTPREAGSHAVVQRVQQAGFETVTVSSHGNPCDVCAEFDGNTYKIGELTDLPPYHPNCGHVLTAGPFDYSA